MKTAIMQPYIFPTISYFQLISSVDTFVIYDNVNFIKMGWINRNYLNYNGEKLQFNINVSKISQNNKINEHFLHKDSDWKSVLLNKLKMCYGEVSRFDKVYDYLKVIIEDQEDNLSKYIANSLIEICRFLQIDTKIIVSSELELNSSFSGEDKIIEICNYLNTSEYINAIGGIELYSSNNFLINDIKLSFLKSNIRGEKYSIIDDLMNFEINELRFRLDQMSLISGKKI